MSTIIIEKTTTENQTNWTAGNHTLTKNTYDNGSIEWRVTSNFNTNCTLHIDLATNELRYAAASTTAKVEDMDKLIEELQNVKQIAEAFQQIIATN